MLSFGIAEIQADKVSSEEQFAGHVCRASRWKFIIRRRSGGGSVCRRGSVNYKATLAG